MSLKNVFFVFLVSLGLAACNATIETEVSIQQLLDKKATVTNGLLNVEVAACADYEDSRKPSNSLIEAQENIPKVFKDAEYKECFKKRFDSFASFSVPLYFDFKQDGKMESSEHVNLISMDILVLTIGIPDLIRERIESLEKTSHGVSAIDLDVQILVKNDTDKDFPVQVLSAYIDDSPVIFADFSIATGESHTFKLSNVSVDDAMQSGMAALLLKPETLKR